MSFDKLTPEEQAFAARNHGLLLSFMRSYRLDDEMYGALSIRYLKTVHRYLTEPKLRQYSFSKVLWMNLRSEMSHELRKTNKSLSCVQLNEELDAAQDPDDLDCEELWEALERVLTKRELEVLEHRTQGRSYREIASLCRITIKAAAGRLYRLRKKIRKL